MDLSAAPATLLRMAEKRWTLTNRVTGETVTLYGTDRDAVLEAHIADNYTADVAEQLDRDSFAVEIAEQ